MVRERLRAATAADHAAVEALMPLAGPAPSPAAYARHLAILEAVYAPVEERILPLLPPELRTWAKAPLLAADLDDLAAPRLPAAFTPAAPTPAFALGAFYVLEGASLGGTLLRRRLAAETTWFADAPARFLGVTTQRWPRFLQVLEREAATHPDEAERGASATFAALLATARGAAW